MNVGLRQLIDRSIIAPLQRKGARLLTKAALFICAAFFFLIAIVSLTVAFFIWLVQLVGAVVASLIFAGLCICVGLIASLFAIYGGRDKATGVESRAFPKTPKSVVGDGLSGRNAFGHDAQAQTPSDEESERAEAINDVVVPVLEVLRSLGLKREELALLAGAELAKKLPPMTLVGLAIICGFLIGRIYKLPFDSFVKKEAA